MALISQVFSHSRKLPTVASHRSLGLVSVWQIIHYTSVTNHRNFTWTDIIVHFFIKNAFKFNLSNLILNFFEKYSIYIWKYRKNKIFDKIDRINYSNQDTLNQANDNNNNKIKGINNKID